MAHSLNNLVLDSQMIAALYGHSLVEDAQPPGPSTKQAKPAKTAVKFLGNNEKKVTILVSDPKHTFLAEDEMAFLTKMLTACQLNTGDVAIVNMATPGYKSADILSQLAPEKMINFGSAEGGALFNEAPKNVTFLNAPSLKELISNTPEAKQLKTNLWNGLKQMFGV